MELADLVETAVIADLNLDPQLARWNPQPHDNPNGKGTQGDPGQNDDQLLLIIVSATDRGDFDGVTGAGIKIVGVEIELVQNVGINADTIILSQAAEKIADRLPATHLIDYSRHQAFSSNKLKVFRIEASENERAEDIDLVRQRVIAREFLCAQVG